MHDIISDIIDWEQANKAYLAGEGQSGERYIQAATNEEVCWLAIAAATVWIPQREPVETALPRKQTTLLDGLSTAQRQLPCCGRRVRRKIVY